MDNLLTMGQNSLPSIIKDPFLKDKVTHLSVKYEDFWGDGKWKASGVVRFKNGNTSGDQKFEGESFDDVVRQIKIFVTNLK